MEKISALIKKLLENTRNSQLAWAESPKDNAFQVSFARFSVVIRQEYNHEFHEEGAFDYFIDVFNENGTMIESVVDTQLTNTVGPGAYPEMKELYALARRRALGTDNAIDEIMEELNSQNLF